MYMFGLTGGPNRPTAPVAGLKAVPAAALLLARFQRADVALKVIGIVEPGSAWMLVSCAGSVKLMITNAFELPVTCHAPAVAAVGSTVVATPLMTVPKFRSRRVAIVIPTVTTTASAEMVAPGCASARAHNVTETANSRALLTELPAAPSREQQEP